MTRRNRTTLRMIDLVPLPRDCLHTLLDSRRIEALGTAVPDGAVPPPHVVRRALALLDAGVDPRWALPFHIVCASRRVVVGGCGFKGGPVDGAVEVGYAVDAAYRRQGFAAAAVRALLDMAYSSRDAARVIAHIVPTNVASIRTVCRLGFLPERVVDYEDGEQVIRWSRECGE